MTMTHLTLYRILHDPSVDLALTMTATMFGLPTVTVTQIVEVSLPLMAHLATTNPEMLRRLHALTREPMPDPIQDLYVRMAEHTPVRQAVMDAYKTTFWGLLDAVNREAARQAGTTNGQARDVLAAALPAVSQVLARATAGNDQEAFGRMLRSLVE